MCKSEIQPLSAFVFGSSDVFLLLVNSHGVPDRVSLRVAAHVVRFHEVEEDDIKGTDAEEDLVASLIYRPKSASDFDFAPNLFLSRKKKKKRKIKRVGGIKARVVELTQRLIVIAIDVHRDDVAGLHEHVVERRRDGTSAHAIGVLRVPADEDGVAVRVRDDAREKHVPDPVAGVIGQRHERDEEREYPDVGRRGDHCAFLEVGGYFGQNKELWPVRSSELDGCWGTKERDYLR